jgi:ABC-type uncharacterized transport system substrate-binding protein
MNRAIALLMAAAASLGQAPADQLRSARSPGLDTQVDHAILMISFDDPGQTHIQQIVQGFQEVLVNVQVPPLLHLEFFDQVRFAHTTYPEEFFQWLSRKYRDRRIDVIVTVEQRALQLLAEQPSSPWRRLPVLYSVWGDLTLDISKSLPMATGVIRENHFPAALRMIKTLMPDTKRIALIYGASAAEQERTLWFVPQVAKASLDLLNLSGLTMEDLLARVAQLPADTVPLFIEFQADLMGRTFTHNQACQLIAGAANRPLFGLFRHYLGCGMVGGPLSDFVEVGRMTARQALKRLGPEPAETVTVPIAQYAPLVFDARQLTRWAILESRLPAGSTVMFREPSLWERYKSYVVGTVALLLLQTTLIAGLLFIYRHQRDLGRRITQVPQAVLRALQRHAWPGNVRELENVIERAMIWSSGDTLQLDPDFGRSRRQVLDELGPSGQKLDEIQRVHIEGVLADCGWRVNGNNNAAERLGVHPNTLRYRMSKLGIVCPPRHGAKLGPPVLSGHAN